MKRAYSYVRFSSRKQLKGDSLRRQLKLSSAWCKKHGYALDETLRLEDLGVSAYRGRNVTDGAFAGFVEAVRGGRVPRGSVLLLESLDRLSRDQIGEALNLFMSLLRQGVEIVTFVPERRYTRESVSDLPGLLEPLVVFSRANEESKMKSHRAREKWDARRAEAAERPLTRVGPAWLALSPDRKRWEPVPERVQAVRRIFQLAREGNGTQRIAAALNRDGIRPMGRGAKWQVSYVWLILRNRAVLGEYQPHLVEDGKRVPAGSPVPNYFPAVLTEEEFYQAQAAVEGRKLARGRRGRHVRNLFTGVLRDARDGQTMVLVTESDSNRSTRLISSGARDGRPGSTYTTFPYDAFEGAFLRLVKELKPADVLPPKARRNGETEVADLSGRLAALEYKLQAVKKRVLAEDDTEALLDIASALEREKKGVAARLEKAREESASAPAENLGEAQALVGLLDRAEGEGRADLRTKIKARVRQLVSEAWALVVTRESDRLCALQLWLADGKRRRDLLIHAKTGGWWQALSLVDVALPGDLDLRRPKDAAALEKALLALDLGALAETSQPASRSTRHA
jgi:DNA invertase Pin-like site-specific DNA recombinase